MPYPNPKTTQRTSNKLISEYESQEMPRILGRNMTVSILDKDYLKFGILDTYYRLNNTGLFRFCSWFFLFAVGFYCSSISMKFHGRIILRRKPTDMKYYMCFRVCKVYHIMYDKLRHIRNGQASYSIKRVLRLIT